MSGLSANKKLTICSDDFRFARHPGVTAIGSQKEAWAELYKSTGGVKSKHLS